ncbi:MAG: ATP-binding cassette domain-containing protein [Candidatus Lokiarchaeota archaeon]
MKLYDKKDDLVKTYSYGMRKKLALIEALIHKPKILLLDEPSMGLDYQSRIAFYHTLDELSSKGITIIIASNDVNEAALLSDRISMLNNGKLLVSGKPDQLIKSLTSYMKIDLELSLPIPLEGLREIEEIEEIQIDDNNKNSEFKLEFLIKPKDFSNYSLLVAKIVNEIVKKKGQIVNINVKTPNLGDLILKLANSGE